MAGVGLEGSQLLIKGRQGCMRPTAGSTQTSYAQIRQVVA